MRTRDDAATVQLKIRIKEPLRAALERDAVARGTTMNAVIAHRLEQSFETQRAFGGPRAQALLRALAGLGIAARPRYTRRDQDDAWLEDWQSRRAVFDQWKQMIDITDTEMARDEPRSPQGLAERLRFERELLGEGSARHLAILQYRNFVVRHYSEKEQQDFVIRACEITGLSENELRSSADQPMIAGNPVP